MDIHILTVSFRKHDTVKSRSQLHIVSNGRLNAKGRLECLRKQMACNFRKYPKKLRLGLWKTP
jgi:hypothetical protein